jgi:UDP-N-acetylglucosamine 2-epimerase (non-hydrolysing)
VPEEVNRRVIDHSSDVLMPYTERSRANLLREGFLPDRVFVTGNPILEVIEAYRAQIDRSPILGDLGLVPRGYFLVTLHRAENVDVEPRLRNFAKAFGRISERHRLPVIVSTHPRAAARIREFGIEVAGGDVRFPRPFGFFDFVTLERNASAVMTDSGTVQEECAILRVPNLTLRDVTERPETIECGSNMLGGSDPDLLAQCIETIMSLEPVWTAPPEYMTRHVSDTVLRIVTGFHLGRRGG